MTPKIQRISRLTRKKLAAAYRAIYAVGALSIFLGLLVTIFSERVTGGIALAIIFFAFGALYMLLGFFVQRQSAIALAIAIAVMTLNTLVGVYNLLKTGSITGLIIPGIFFSQTAEGFKAMQELKRDRQSSGEV